MVRWGEKGVSYQRSRLAGDNATHKRKECMERTCEGVIVLTQSEEDIHLRVVGCLYWMSRLPCIGYYVYNGAGVNQLRLLGLVPEIGALLPALTRVGSGVLSLIGRRCGWDERSESVLLWPLSIRGGGL